MNESQGYTDPLLSMGKSFQEDINDKFSIIIVISINRLKLLKKTV